MPDAVVIPSWPATVAWLVIFALQFALSAHTHRQVRHVDGHGDRLTASVAGWVLFGLVSIVQLGRLWEESLYLGAPSLGALLSGPALMVLTLIQAFALRYALKPGPMYNHRRRKSYRLSGWITGGLVTLNAVLQIVTAFVLGGPR